MIVDHVWSYPLVPISIGDVRPTERTGWLDGVVAPPSSVSIALHGVSELDARMDREVLPVHSITAWIAVSPQFARASATNILLSMTGDFRSAPLSLRRAPRFGSEVGVLHLSNGRVTRPELLPAERAPSGWAGAAALTAGRAPLPSNVSWRAARTFLRCPPKPTAAQTRRSSRTPFLPRSAPCNRRDRVQLSCACPFLVLPGPGLLRLPHTLERLCCA
jgi:hypothetical protein